MNRKARRAAAAKRLPLPKKYQGIQFGWEMRQEKPLLLNPGSRQPSEYNVSFQGKEMPLLEFNKIILADLLVQAALVELQTADGKSYAMGVTHACNIPLIRGPLPIAWGEMDSFNPFMQEAMVYAMLIADGLNPEHFSI